MPNNSAILVSVRLKRETFERNSSDELERLAETAKIQTVDKIYIAVNSFLAAAFIGRGKIDEIKNKAIERKADILIFDNELSPNQEKNLNKLLRIPVITRTTLILEIFSNRAKTREGKLQVELAKLSYQMGRLAGKGKELSQQRGIIGTRGPGETKIEYEKRTIRKKVVQLKKELESVKKERSVQYNKRNSVPMPQVAIVGYTNAGKSSLLNELNDAKQSVYADDKLFATLDPLTKRVSFPGGGKALFTDTVGFIQKLPHDLIAAFRSTMEEIKYSDIIIHLHDLSSEDLMNQHITVEKTIKELAGDKLPPVINVYNKIDKIRRLKQRKETLRGFNPVFISALKKTGVKTLLKAVKIKLHEKWKKRTIKFLQENAGFLNELYDLSMDVKLRYSKKHIIAVLNATDSNYNRLKSRLAKMRP